MNWGHGFDIGAYGLVPSGSTHQPDGGNWGKRIPLPVIKIESALAAIVMLPPPARRYHRRGTCMRVIGAGL